MRTLIYVEQDTFEDSIALLEVANQIADGREHETYAVCYEADCPGMHGHFDHWITVEVSGLQQWDIRNSALALEQLQAQYDFDNILIPATFFGRMLAPRLAMRLHVGLVADVTEIHVENGRVELVRPAFDGKIMAGIVTQKRKPVMASIRPGVFSYLAKEKKETKTSVFTPQNLHSSGIRLLEEREKEPVQDIRHSTVLASGGGGMSECFDQVGRLAGALNGMAAASRRIVDSGIANRSIQVGQSGKTVSPRLYLAMGIYGSLQHVEGLKDVEHIISVNTNKNAPICSLSDIVVEGDGSEFVDKLVAKLEKEAKASPGVESTSNNIN